MANRQRLERIRLPQGTLVYPALQTPDTKFDSGGVYKTDVKLDPTDPAVAALITKLEGIRDTFREEQMAAAKGATLAKMKKAKVKPVVKPEYDDDGEETGMVLFHAKQKAVVTSTTTGRTHTFGVSVYDAQKNVLKKDVWSGSVANVVVDIQPWAVMTDDPAFLISLKLVAVQVIDFVGPGGSKGGDFFDCEEGYVEPQEGAADDPAPAVDAPAPEGSNGDSARDF